MADDGLLREVDDDVRAEQIMQLWRKYRSLLAVAVISIIVATTGDTLWQNYRVHRGGVWLEKLTAAQALFAQGKYADAEKGFGTVAGEASGELADVAHIWQARSLVGAGKMAEAIALLKTTAAHGHGLWADVACLRVAAINAKEATCLADKKDSPLVWQRQQWAAAELWKAGDHAKAIETVNALVADANTPEAARAELQQWLATMKGAK